LQMLRNYCFFYCSNLQPINIPSSIYCIPYGCFRDFFTCSNYFSWRSGIFWRLLFS
jgi:hypothetical protein